MELINYSRDTAWLHYLAIRAVRRFHHDILNIVFLTVRLSGQW